VQPWKPREHDHLVEPMFAGLGARRDPSGAPASLPRGLLIGAAAVSALIGLRALLLWLR
jgi:hypothetical protein